MNKNKYLYLIATFFIFLLGMSSCGSDKPCKNTASVSDSTITTQSTSLAEFIHNSGNIITKKEFPYFVHASDIFYYKDEFLLLDIRDTSSYIAGHIDGAYNVNRQNLMTFLTDSVNPAAYKKIAIIDANGPEAEYVATLLRFDGYNAFGLKFGIGSWNRSLVGNIQKYLGNKYANFVDTIPVTKPQAGQIPDFTSNNIVSLLNQRVTELIAEDVQNFIVPEDEVFANFDDYFVLAYWSEAKYNSGHIRGSVRYNTRSDLSYDALLNTLPTDKKILVYCNTGHHAIAIVAYLRLLGYDACSIMYGVNSFMNLKLKTFAPGAAITDANVLSADFPLLTGKDRTSTKVEVADNGGQSAPPPVIPVQRQTGGGNVGGCE